MRKVIIVLLAVFVLSSCFSPWEGDKPDSGSITVGIGSSAGGRSVEWAPDESTYKSWNHEIIVRSKNSSAIYEGEITPSASIFSLTFDNIPNGSYDVEVWARSSSAIGNDLMAVGKTSVTVAGSAINANVQMYPPVYIPPNQHAQDRYIYWDGKSFTAIIHQLIIENYAPTNILLRQGGSPPLPPIESYPAASTVLFSLSSLTPTAYGDDLYIELYGGSIGTYPLRSNIAKLWRPINTALDLAKLNGALAGESYILTGDITVTSTSPPTLPGLVTFDGNGNEITYSPPSIGSSFIGLINTNNGTITNLKVNCSMNLPSLESALYLGAVTGRNAGIIKNVSVIGSIGITSSPGPCYVGGIAGINFGIIQNCYFDGVIDIISSSNATSEVGGIAGRNDNEILNCWASGLKVKIIAPINSNVGGIAGSTSSLIENCVALQDELELVNGTIRRIAADLGSSTYSNNYANEDMILTPWGHPVVVGPSTQDGASTLLFSMNTNWWTTSGVGWARVDIDVWGGTEDKPWTWGSGRPVLWFEN